MCHQLVVSVFMLSYSNDVGVVSMRLVGCNLTGLLGLVEALVFGDVVQASLWAVGPQVRSLDSADLTSVLLVQLTICRWLVVTLMLVVLIVVIGRGLILFLLLLLLLLLLLVLLLLLWGIVYAPSDDGSFVWDGSHIVH
jgi:hypothetical protein